MSHFLIRLYKDSDYVAVRRLFACGTNEHANGAFKRGIRRPHFGVTLLIFLILPFFDIVSFTTSIIALAVDISFVWLVVWHLFKSYVEFCLRDDLMDIQKYYMNQDGACFWVAESGGQVVGTVATAPSPYTGGEKHLELKRLSVSKSHRGRGIAKALCRTVIDFARQRRDCEAVILTTNIVQIDAWKMYEKMGFKLDHTFYLPTRFIKLLDLKTFFYRYNIPKLQ
ncbi:putative N-acetyltransferase camello [Lithobates pipiens]